MIVAFAYYFENMVVANENRIADKLLEWKIEYELFQFLDAFYLFG